VVIDSGVQPELLTVDANHTLVQRNPILIFTDVGL